MKLFKSTSTAIFTLGLFFTLTAGAAAAKKKYEGLPDTAEESITQAQGTMAACNDPYGRCNNTYNGGTGFCRNSFGAKLEGQELKNCVAALIEPGSDGNAQPKEDESKDQK